MPTILAHMAVPLAIGLALGAKTIPRRLLLAGVVGSMLPDLDVVAFRFGIAYASDYGHRGISHSLLFAAALAMAAAMAARHLQASVSKAWLFLFIAIASHGLLDCLTNGGLGAELFWPFSSERYFAPWHPIEVSPIGISRFLTPRGAAVLASEAAWVWLPCVVLATILRSVMCWITGRIPVPFAPPKDRT